MSLSENVTYRVVDRRDGMAYALRLHRPWYHTLDELISERDWIRALADAGIAVQAPMRTRDGQEYASVTIQATGERRFAGLARWTTGRVLAEVLRETADTRTAERHFEQLGAVTASLHPQAAAWQPPAGFTRRALDDDGFMGSTPHWGPFWDHQGLSAAERRLMLDTRARLHGALARLERQPAIYSMIYADMHPGNVLVDGDRLTVIDFDDAAWGWHAYDMSVALFFHQSGPTCARSSAPISPATGRCGGCRSSRWRCCRCSGWFAAWPRSAGSTSAPNSTGRRASRKRRPSCSSSASRSSGHFDGPS